jgi:hypothetical protein
MATESILPLVKVLLAAFAVWQTCDTQLRDERNARARLVDENAALIAHGSAMNGTKLFPLVVIFRNVSTLSIYLSITYKFMQNGSMKTSRNGESVISLRCHESSSSCNA